MKFPWNPKLSYLKINWGFLYNFLKLELKENLVNSYNNLFYFSIIKEQMNHWTLSFSSMKSCSPRKEQFYNLEQIQKWFFIFFLFQKKLHNFTIYKDSEIDSWEIKDYGTTLTYIFLLFSIVIHQSKNRDEYISSMKFQYTPFWITPFWYRILFKDVWEFLMERVEKNSVKDEYHQFLSTQLKSIPLSPLEQKLSLELIAQNLLILLFLILWK